MNSSSQYSDAIDNLDSHYDQELAGSSNNPENKKGFKLSDGFVNLTILISMVGLILTLVCLEIVFKGLSFNNLKDVVMMAVILFMSALRGTILIVGIAVLQLIAMLPEREVLSRPVKPKKKDYTNEDGSVDEEYSDALSSYNWDKNFHYPVKLLFRFLVRIISLNNIKIVLFFCLSILTASLYWYYVYYSASKGKFNDFTPDSFEFITWQTAYILAIIAEIVILLKSSIGKPTSTVEMQKTVNELTKEKNKLNTRLNNIKVENEKLISDLDDSKIRVDSLTDQLKIYSESNGEAENIIEDLTRQNESAQKTMNTISMNTLLKVILTSPDDNKRVYKKSAVFCPTCQTVQPLKNLEQDDKEIFCKNPTCSNFEENEGATPIHIPNRIFPSEKLIQR